MTVAAWREAREAASISQTPWNIMKFQPMIQHRPECDSLKQFLHNSAIVKGSDEEDEGGAREPIRTWRTSRQQPIGRLRFQKPSTDRIFFKKPPTGHLVFP